MASRRERIQEFYAQPRGLRNLQLDSLSKSLTAQARTTFNEGVSLSAVLRADLNGYSAWAQSHTLPQRRDLLDEFFTTAVTGLQSNGRNGVYYREEGDCLVALFSPRFGAQLNQIQSFSQLLLPKQFQGLSCKISVSAGSIAYFQKAHELGTEDWSAEGDPFVRAARLEAAIKSEPACYVPEDDFLKYIEPGIAYSTGGTSSNWYWSSEPLRAEGMQAQGGWLQVRVLRFR